MHFILHSLQRESFAHRVHRIDFFLRDLDSHFFQMCRKCIAEIFPAAFRQPRIILDQVCLADLVAQLPTPKQDDLLISNGCCNGRRNPGRPRANNGNIVSFHHIVPLLSIFIRCKASTFHSFC